MATVEQCETQTSGLSNTLNIYDTFKTSHEDEKDSDEESFHLPLLDCDDDSEANKETSTTDSSKELHNGETEDEILNKFETNGTPDIDPKMEDSILDEIDNILEKKVDEVDVAKTNNCDGAETKKVVSSEDKKDVSDSASEILNNSETIPDNQDSESNDKVGNEKKDNSNETLTTEETSNKEMDTVDENNKINKTESDATKNISETNEASTDIVQSVDTVNNPSDTVNNTDESCKQNLMAQEKANLETKSEENPEKNDLVECREENNTPNTDLKDTTVKSSDNESGTEAMEVDSKDDAVNEEKKLPEGSTEESMDIKNAQNSVQTTVEPEKCENSNDSNKSQDLECEDLLDISIIRDADEDDASAIEENANDVHASEKSDNDNDDQDEISDKAENEAENELDESEMDQEDTMLTIEKDDNMDFEDGGSNLCEQENVVSENVSDSESKSNTEMKKSEIDSHDSDDKSDINQVTSNDKERTEEENCVPKDSIVTEENQETLKETENKSCIKRTLSEADVTESPNKKIKLLERSKSEDKVPTQKNNEIKTLLSFENFMQNKKLENKLTRSDLEQFCLQKICEAIMHKTDVGELHQTIKKQEQIIESLRKDLQQLTKQTRDLDIVNKKLMSELRVQNGTKKPLVPLKITRSVGLQVKLSSTSEPSNRRKGSTPSTPRTPNNNNSNVRPRNITPANASIVRQVATSPRKTPSTAPLLSQALQNRQTTPANSTKRAAIRPKPAEPQKPPNPGVIDLTDEDDKASKGAVGATVKILNKTIPLTQGKTINIIPAKTVPNKMLNTNQNKTVAVGQLKTGNVGAKMGTTTRTVATLPQGVRLTPTQVKNGSIAIPASVVTSSSGTTQFMYVVQPGPVVTSTAGGTQKTVLLNFQPTNGVLTSTLNGSAVSVLPSKTSNAVQLKTVSASRKHPAPLPSPPPVTLNTSLKPLLPKPHLSIRKTDTGIILQWRMPYNLDIYESIASYQLFAYQETNAPPSTDMWRKVGDVKALALPMACTLTQFADKNKYYFAVRSIDVHKRIGAFSDPEEISL